MSSQPEVGWITGSTGYHTEAACAASDIGEPLWPDTPHIRKGGGWRPEELRTVESHAGKVAVYGECLATDAELRAAAENALRSNDPATITAMPGSYTSIIINKNTTRFVGDSAAQYPLYYRSEKDGGITFATHTEPFRTGPQAAPPDRLSLALGVGMPWVYELTAGRTVVAGVSAILPQESVNVHRGGTITTTRHDSMFSAPRLSVDEAAEQLRAALLLGAKRRVNNGRKIAVDFSGGYDSTSEAYVFASVQDEPLTAVTHHSPDMPLDDMDYVQKYLALPDSAGKFDHHVYEYGVADAMYGGLDTITPGDVPDISMRDKACYEDYYAYLRQLGVEMHINGVGGDVVTDMRPGQYLGHFKRPWSIGYFARAVLQTARTEKTSVPAVLASIKRADALDPRTLLLQLAHVLHTPGTYDADYIGDIFGMATAPQWLTRAMRKEIAEYAAERADHVAVPGRMTPADYRAYTTLLTMGPAQHGMTQHAATHGLRTSTLYFDNDVLKACFGLPAYKRMDPWVFKKLMGHAFSGIVPSEVTSRTTKSLYTRHGLEGLRKARGRIQALLRDSRLADLGIINPQVVETTFDDGFMGAAVPGASVAGLIASELWLRGLDDASWDARGYAAPPAVIKKEKPKPAAALDQTARYGTAPGVVVATRAVGAGALHMRAGSHVRLNQYSLTMLRALQATSTLGAAYDILERTYPNADSTLLRTAATQWMQDLVRHGIVAVHSTEFAILEGQDATEALPSQMVRVADNVANVRPMDYVAAFAGLALGRRLERSKSFEQQMQRLGTIREKLTRKPATADEATRILAASHRIAMLALERAACLELSRAAVIGAALRGRRLSLVLGTQSDPESFHAWTETADGTAIRTDADEQIARVYQPLIRL
ncbi:MAG TPA: lasso peptide biosynthesis B2 protein [Candidatus Saccharimonadales bacterium]|nr:lasso peptide biosynthesis B2 protein [Candidatus Saccharimonadales bacterium]